MGICQSILLKKQWNEDVDTAIKLLQKKELISLDLRRQLIDDRQVFLLMANLNDQVTEVNLAENKISKEGIKVIARKLHYEASKGKQDAVDPKAGAASGGSPKLVTSGSSAKLMHKGTSHHKRMKYHENMAVRKLDLSMNSGLDEEALLPLAEVLKNNQCLETLILNYNRIGFSAISAIAFGLRANQSLDTLVLVGNNVGDEGCKSLGEALKVNKHLSQLVLVDNQISDKGAIALTSELYKNTGTSLLGLNLGSNFVTDAGAEKLAKAVRTSNITTLLLDQNLIGDDGAMRLLNAMKPGQTKRLENVSLWNNPIESPAILGSLEAHRNPMFTLPDGRQDELADARVKYGKEDVYECVAPSTASDPLLGEGAVILDGETEDTVLATMARGARVIVRQVKEGVEEERLGWCELGWVRLTTPAGEELMKLKPKGTVPTFIPEAEDGGDMGIGVMWAAKDTLYIRAGAEITSAPVAQLAFGAHVELFGKMVVDSAGNCRYRTELGFTTTVDHKGTRGMDLV